MWEIKAFDNNKRESFKETEKAENLQEHMNLSKRQMIFEAT